MPSALKISDLSANLQERLSDTEALFEEHYSMLDLQSEGIAVFEDVEDKLPLYHLQVADPNQPGNRGTQNFKTNLMVWKNRTLQVRHAELSIKIAQQEINSMFRTHLAKIRNASKSGDLYQLPFEDYLLQRTLAASKHNLALLTLWKGVYNAAGTTSSDIADGLLTKIVADIADGDIPAGNVVAGAPITANNAVAQFKLIIDKMIAERPEYMLQPMVMYCAPEVAKMYWDNYQATLGSLQYNMAYQKRIVNDMENIVLKPQLGLTGSQRVILTVPENFTWGSDAMSNMVSVTVEKHLRDLYMLVDWQLGTEYSISELIFCNDQA